MPARRKTVGLESPKSDGNRSNDEAYQLKRKRNNDAVKKTRAKSKQTAQERKENVEKLRIRNTILEAQIEEKESNVEKLKDILLQNIDPEKHDEMIKKILEGSVDDQDD